MYDIAIVGGGPAGAALARLIGSRFKVLLLEKRRGQEGVSCKAQEKCCGGLIDPDAQKMLARFRLGIPKEVLLSPQLFAVRVIDIHNSIERYYQRHYINIDREMFDKWLLSIAVHFCTVQTGCVFKSFEEQDDCVIIKYCSEGKEYTERTKLLVGADGAFSMVRRKGFPEVQLPELYVSIQEWYEAEGAQDFYGAIFDEDITDFYSWTIPKENVIILGSAIKAGPGVLQKFELLKKKLEKYGFDFHKFLRRNGAYMLRPKNLKQICPGKGRIALIGEAAGLISPSSAEGMSYAFKSALALCRSLDNGIEGYEKQYRRNLNSLYRNIALKNLKSPAIYNPFVRELAMKSRFMSIDVEEQ